VTQRTKLYIQVWRIRRVNSMMEFWKSVHTPMINVMTIQRKTNNSSGKLMKRKIDFQFTNTVQTSNDRNTIRSTRNKIRKIFKKSSPVQETSFSPLRVRMPLPDTHCPFCSWRPPSQPTSRRPRPSVAGGGRSCRRRSPTRGSSDPAPLCTNDRWLERFN